MSIWICQQCHSPQGFSKSMKCFACEGRLQAMTINYDWVTEAAEEIAKIEPIPGVGWKFFIEGVILRHSPFRPDVAYMPVPRCETCVLWMRRDKETGLCGLRELSQAKLWPEMYDAIVTTEDFGCVQWKAKQCAFTFDVLINDERKRCGLLDGHDGLHEWRAK